jgi:hypothetical protein
MATRDVDAGDFFSRGFLALGGWRVVVDGSWKRVGGGAGDGEKICRNWRRGEGPGCFGVVRVLVLGAVLLFLLDQTLFFRFHQILIPEGGVQSLVHCSG